MLCAVVLIVFVKKIFEFEFFVKYCVWAGVMQQFLILVQNTKIV